jgi:hypothetical protein
MPGFSAHMSGHSDLAGRPGSVSEALAAAAASTDVTVPSAAIREVLQNSCGGQLRLERCSHTRASDSSGSVMVVPARVGVPAEV